MERKKKREGRKKKIHTEGGKKNGRLTFLLSVGDKAGNFKIYIQYNKLFET